MKKICKIIAILLTVLVIGSLASCKKALDEDAALEDRQQEQTPAGAAEKEVSADEEKTAESAAPEDEKPEPVSDGGAAEETGEPAEETAAPAEKSVLNISVTKGIFPKSYIIKGADLIVRGKVVSKDSEVMTNPDGTRKDENGNAYENRLVTDYTVEVYDVYKGNWDEDTIQVRTSAGRGLSPDLILYGEDEKTILEHPVERYELEVGGECILCLKHVVEAEHDDPACNGYYPLCDKCGYLKSDGNGNYQNSGVGEVFSLSADTAAQEIAEITA